jgi:hypothetical protein
MVRGDRLFPALPNGLDKIVINIHHLGDQVFVAHRLIVEDLCE